jgi:UDP-N-acetylmuramoyl-L-alanyl-D-glutamate--2,6-diaminopimelate ligase
MEKKVTLSKVLSALGLPPSSQEVWFTGVCQDTQLCQPDDLLIVRPGHRHSCEEILQKAVFSCVKYLVTDHPSFPDTPGILCLRVPDIGKTLAPLYDLFYPDLPRHRVGVTGTDGKTSVTHFLMQLWEMSALNYCAMGTLGTRSFPDINGTFSFPRMTTPSGSMLYEILSACLNQNIDHVVFEASSHALFQSRISPLKISTAIFTNFSQDHLDYHKTMDAYWQAKCRLLTEHGCSHAVLFNQLPHEHLICLCRESKISPLFFGPETTRIEGHLNATYSLLGQKGWGQRVSFSLPGVEWETTIPLIGEFQVQNLLAALCAFSLEGGDLGAIIPHLREIKPILGRMEYVGSYNEAAIYVDYAHTPDALEKALLTLRPYVKNRLGVVFGCGGDRDREKRPLMGKISDETADWAIITDDNPRSEDPRAIRADIKKGCPHAIEVGCREKAITQALQKLRPGDIILVAGKGHETTQIIGHQVLPFSDQALIRSLIKGLLLFESECRLKREPYWKREPFTRLRSWTSSDVLSKR